MCFVYIIWVLELNEIYEAVSRVLGDCFSYSYFPFNRRSENQAQVTYRASLGKPVVPIVVIAH